MKIRKVSNDVRKKGAMSVQIVSNADEIVLQTLQYITSSNPKFAVLCTAREVVKMAAFQTKLNNEQGDQSPVVCLPIAKRGSIQPVQRPLFFCALLAN